MGSFLLTEAPIRLGEGESELWFVCPYLSIKPPLVATWLGGLGSTAVDMDRKWQLCISSTDSLSLFLSLCLLDLSHTEGTRPNSPMQCLGESVELKKGFWDTFPHFLISWAGVPRSVNLSGFRFLLNSDAKCKSNLTVVTQSVISVCMSVPHHQPGGRSSRIMSEQIFC